MGQIEKLINRLKSKPKDFTFDEAETLLNHFNYVKSDKGKTSGSKVIFNCKNRASIMLHKPHPHKELRIYQIKQLLNVLEQEELL